MGGQFSVGKWKKKYFGKMKLVAKHSNLYQIPFSLMFTIMFSILELVFSLINRIGKR